MRQSLSLIYPEPLAKFVGHSKKDVGPCLNEIKNHMAEKSF